MASGLQVVVSSQETRPSFGQQLLDHERIIDSYLDTHITRNHRDATRHNEQCFLQRWFNSQGDDGRPLFVWAAMEPIHGRERVVSYAKEMIKERRLASSTIGGRLGILRRLFSYVLEWPYIPESGGTSIQARYGPVEQPVLMYDYPAHVWGGRCEDAPLIRPELHRLYGLLRQRIRNMRKPAVAARDYAMVVIAAESGLRIGEICELDINRDLLFDQGRLQTRAGKATNGSGPRVRTTIFTPFAQATLRHYLDHVRSSFHRWSHHPRLFLSERGRALTESAAQNAMKGVVNAARRDKLRIPPRFGWHSLRRSFATIYSEEHPGSDHTLMEMLGHINPSTLYRYIHHSRAYHEKVMDDVLIGLAPRG